MGSIETALRGKRSDQVQSKPLIECCRIVRIAKSLEILESKVAPSLMKCIADHRDDLDGGEDGFAVIPLMNLLLRLSRCRRFWLLLQDTRINRLTCSRNRLKVQLVAADLDQHESSIGVEAGCHDVGALPEVMVSELPGVPHQEKVNSLFRFEALVYMIVP